MSDRKQTEGTAAISECGPHHCPTMLQLKLCYSDQIRRTRTAATSLAFDTIVRIAKKLFASLPHDEIVELVWIDEDRDIIVASSDEELAEAVRVMGGDSTQCLRFEVRSLPLRAPEIARPPRVTNALSPVHDGVRCTGCEARGKDNPPIIGTQYKCFA